MHEKPTFYSWREAARHFGAISPLALRKRILRHNNRPGVEPVRMAHSLVHRGDFERWMERLTRRPQTAQDYGRQEAARIDRGIRLHGGRR